MVGLYSVLWGKHKERRDEDDHGIQEIPEAVKVCIVGQQQQNCNKLTPMITEDLEGNEAELKKAELSAVVIAVPVASEKAVQMSRGGGKY